MIVEIFLYVIKISIDNLFIRYELHGVVWTEMTPNWGQRCESFVI